MTLAARGIGLGISTGLALGVRQRPQELATATG
jgi:hypothetical protein